MEPCVSNENEPVSEIELLKELLEEDSDSAPEEVSFTDSQKDTLAKLKNVQQQVRQRKEKLKEERRKLQEKFIAQKLKKQQSSEAFESKKLPEDILQQISSSEPPKRPQPLKQQPSIHSSKHKHDTETADLDEGSLKHRQDLPDTEEFISLYGTTEFHVSVLDNEVRKAKSLSEKALEFKKQFMYGKRVKRHSAEQFLGQMKKRVIGGHIKLKQ